MLTRKIVARKVAADAVQLGASIHPVLQRVYAARAVTSAAELDYSLAALLPFHTLGGVAAAAQLLQQAIAAQQRILVVADFDTDGATSCALLMRGLALMGATNIMYLVPNRFEYSYGLTPALVTAALQYDPDLLITVDNGISSIAGVRYAKENGVTVLITDHHLPGDTLPAADVIVNPQLNGDRFPSKNLAGVGVVFYSLLALRARLSAQNWFHNHDITYPNLARLLDLVALGTIADVVPLDRNNRIMVAHGLKLIRKQQCIAGITALLQQAGCQQHTITAADLSFAIAPRLNAAGRLTDMSLGVECLISDDSASAQTIAVKLQALNEARRALQTKMQAEADAQLAAYHRQDHLALGICLFNDSWHQGIIGIIAGRLCETFNCPAIIFATATEYQDNTLIKGSCRSIAGIHMRDVLVAIDQQYPDLMLSFGGHSMAAGLTLAKAEFEVFKTAYMQVLKAYYAAADINAATLTDGTLTASDCSLALALEIAAAGPWGAGFPEPVFEGQFDVVHKYMVADKHLKLKLKLSDARIIDAIAFNTTATAWPSTTTTIFATYRLAINDFSGTQKLQILLDYLQPV